jgi:hypothetical protein
LKGLTNPSFRGKFNVEKEKSSCIPTSLSTVSADVLTHVEFFDIPDADLKLFSLLSPKVRFNAYLELKNVKPEN